MTLRRGRGDERFLKSKTPCIIAGVTNERSLTSALEIPTSISTISIPIPDCWAQLIVSFEKHFWNTDSDSPAWRFESSESSTNNSSTAVCERCWKTLLALHVGVSELVDLPDTLRLLGFWEMLQVFLPRVLGKNTLRPSSPMCT